MPFLHLEISDDLHRKIKVAAATEGKTLKAFVIEALERAVADAGPVKRA